jgi:hypothetical protein
MKNTYIVHWVSTQDNPKIKMFKSKNGAENFRKFLKSIGKDPYVTEEKV